MKFLTKLSPIALFTVIILLALLTFTLGLWIVFAFQAKSIATNKIVNSINNSEKMMNFDSTIPLERALQTYGTDQTLAIFNNKCKSVYVTDLKIIEGNCLSKDPRYEWIKIQSSYKNNSFLVGFHLDYSFISFAKDYSNILLATTFSYLVFVSLSTYFFFRYFLFLPIREINLEINSILKNGIPNSEIFLASSNTLLSKLYEALTHIVNELVRLNREEEKSKISKQIVHDLRAPLSVLELNSNTLIDSPTMNTLALRRIREISDGLLGSKTTNNSNHLDIIKLINEFKIIYPQINIIHEVTHKTNSFYNLLGLTETELFRFLSNLIKNSIEARASVINVKTTSDNNYLYLSLKDNGEGLHPDNITNILRGASFKEDGHGLGISSIHEKLLGIQGELHIDTSVLEGFEVMLKVPIFCPELYVLIDDDRIIRAKWSTEAAKKNISFKGFSSVDEFLSETKPIALNSILYIDSNLGNGKKGEIESKEISEKGYKHIYLATGYSPSDFDLAQYPWLMGIISKAPPF